MPVAVIGDTCFYHKIHLLYSSVIGRGVFETKVDGSDLCIYQGKFNAGSTVVLSLRKKLKKNVTAKCLLLTVAYCVFSSLSFFTDITELYL